MSIVNVHEAKSNLSRLLASVEAGEEVVIARDGMPIARLVAVEPTAAKRELGALRGQIWIAEDFDAPLNEEEMARFEGGT